MKQSIIFIQLLWYLTVTCMITYMVTPQLFWHTHTLNVMVSTSPDHRPTSKKSYVNRKKILTVYFSFRGETRKLQASKKYVSIFGGEKKIRRKGSKRPLGYYRAKRVGEIRKKLLEPPFPFRERRLPPLALH